MLAETHKLSEEAFDWLLGEIEARWTTDYDLLAPPSDYFESLVYLAIKGFIFFGLKEFRKKYWKVAATYNFRTFKQRLSKYRV